MKNSPEKSERGQGRGAAVGANRMGRGVHAERVTATKNNSSKTTGSSKRINEKKNATHDKLDTVAISNVKSSSKQVGNSILCLSTFIKSLKVGWFRVA